MCGIAGLFCPTSFSESDQAIQHARDMLALIGHRGPDEAGLLATPHCLLGNVRLSIIDLSSGQQPLADASGRFWIAYNGELYNYIELRQALERRGVSFLTNSDTEVVLQAYIHHGPSIVADFNGAFAFAIYDRHSQQLFMARDRYGKRPLFYAHHRGQLLFASEMKAFLAIPDFAFEPNLEELASTLAVWTPLPHQTGFQGVQQLPNGCSLTINASDTTPQIEAYVPPAPKGGDFNGDIEDARQAVRDALADAVRLRLRSDVEVGVYLSGGLDSSIITHLTTQLSNHKVRTFSVTFEDQQFDESEPQQLVSKHLGTLHHAQPIAARDIAENFPAAVYHAEMPVFRTAFVPMFLLSRMVQNEKIKVILSGEGADEAFLGYNLFKDTLLRSQWHQYSTEERKAKLSRFYPYLDHFGGDNANLLMGLYQQFQKETLPGLFSHEIRFQNGRFAARLMKGIQSPFAPILEYVQQTPSFAELSLIEKAQWLEFRTLLAGYLLSSQGERMGLAHAVENRCPFLDPNVVKLAMSLNLRFDDGYDEKHLLKTAFADALPKEITARHKHPYRAPDSAAFVAHRPEYLDLLLSDEYLAEMPYLNARFIQKLTAKIFNQPAQAISIKENQAFVFLLSLLLRHHFFTKRQATYATTPAQAQVRLIDFRGDTIRETFI